MLRKPKLIAVLFFTLLSFKQTPCEALIDSVTNLATMLCTGNYTVEAGLYTGFLNIKSKELVLPSRSEDPRKEISHLDWTANAVWILGARGRLMNPQTGFHASLDGWTKLCAAGIKMVDKDYLDESRPDHVTDISTHHQTKLKTAVNVDLELGKAFLRSNNPKSCWSLGYLYGAQFTKIDWDVHGGKYKYDDGAVVGRFPSSWKIISYTQNYLIPYLGLEGGWQYNEQVSFRVYGKYTWFGFILTKDEHWLRDISFTDTFRFVHYWIAGLDAVYRYNDCVLFNLRYKLDWLDREKGHVHVHESGSYSGTGKGAGIENLFQTLTVGLALRF